MRALHDMTLKHPLDRESPPESLNDQQLEVYGDLAARAGTLCAQAGAAPK